MKVLVTGGVGFIGSNLVRRLVERGDQVRVLDNLATGRRENLEDVWPDIEFIDADIRELASCSAACAGVDAVLHQAAVGSVPRSLEDPATSHDVNVNGTTNMLLAARDHDVGRFVFASSSAVYGDAPEEVKTENLSPRPLSPYAASKLAAEAYTVAFKHSYGMKTVALRYFNVFGPYQDPNSMYAAVFPLFASALLSGESPTIHGDGQQSRDFTFVENVVQANLLALECPDDACGKYYNIACGRSFTVSELFSTMRQRIGGAALQIEPVYAPFRKGDVRCSLASIEEARRGLGYNPEIEFDEGVAATIDWYGARRRKASQA